MLQEVAMYLLCAVVVVVDEEAGESMIEAVATVITAIMVQFSLHTLMAKLLKVGTIHHMSLPLSPLPRRIRLKSCGLNGLRQHQRVTKLIPPRLHSSLPISWPCVMLLKIVGQAKRL